MNYITFETLTRHQTHTNRLRICLGDELCSWMLKSEARKELGLETPRIPTDKGSLVVLFKRSERLEGCIAKGYGLPFIWRQSGDPSNSRAPQAMIEKANRIKSFLGSSYANWWVDLHISATGISLRNLEMEVESAAVPLAAGLLLANNEGQPSPFVLSTGAINEEKYIDTVDGYEEKLLAVDTLIPVGESDRFFYVPSADLSIARKAAKNLGSTVTIKAFEVNNPFNRVMGSLLIDMDQKPLPSASFETHRLYANRPHIVFSPTRSSYYKKYLVRTIGEKVPKPPELRNATVQKLLLPVSLRPDNTFLSLAIHRPEAVNFVVSNSSRKQLDKVSEFASSLGIKSITHKLVPIEDEAVQVSTIQDLQQWLEGAPQEGRVVDFTPGTREMLAVVVAAGIASQAHLVYVRHSMVPETNRIEFGTEELAVFKFSTR